MDQNRLTNDPQELLKNKQDADKQKQQFSSFVRGISDPGSTEPGPVTEEQHHEPDQQNHMKDTENRMS